METSRPASPQPGNGNGNGHGPEAGRGPAGHNGVGKLTLVEAAQLIERLQGRAAHERELEALRIARDALLVIVSEGFSTHRDRLRSDVQPVLPESAREPTCEPVREPARAPSHVPAREPALERAPVPALAGGSLASFRAAFSPHR